MNHPNSGNIYLMSFTRSGSNWLRYCFEFITKRRTQTREESWNTGAFGRELLFHLHEESEYNMNVGDVSNIPKIILVRNYKECVPSHIQRSDYRWMQRAPYLSYRRAGIVDPVFSAYLQRYCRLLNTFEESYDATLSLHICYEEFIEKPARSLAELIRYIDNIRSELSGYIPSLETMTENMLELLENYRSHRLAALDTYRGKKGGAAHSGDAMTSGKKGNSFHFYCRWYFEDELAIIDEETKSFVLSTAYEKYLQRYTEQERK